MLKNYFIFISLLFIIFNLSCSDPTSTKDSIAPVVNILEPADNSEFDDGTTITIRASASDKNAIKDVTVYIDGNVETIMLDEPYSYDWNTAGKLGNHIIQVKASDQNDNVGESGIVNIFINNVIPNTPPSALFTFSPDNGSTFSTFQFDASACTDNEDQASLLHVRWDWENDNNWDTNFSITKTASHQYQNGGNYSVKMELKDSGGLTDTIAIQINVINLETSTVTDIDGNVYTTVKIGNQWWMAANLKTTRYRNGDVIQNITANLAWTTTTNGAYCSYNNINTVIVSYGLLYNWYAVDDNRSIAPAGWHVPSDYEWKELEMHLGMSQSDANSLGSRGTDEGSKLKATTSGGNNISGFSAVMSGFRWVDGAFQDSGAYASWWTTTEFSGWIYSHDLSRSSPQVLRVLNFEKYFGFSVRCVKD